MSVPFFVALYLTLFFFLGAIAYLVIQYALDCDKSLLTPDPVESEPYKKVGEPSVEEVMLGTILSMGK
jgi:hypothetical protein